MFDLSMSKYLPCLQCLLIEKDCRLIIKEILSGKNEQTQAETFRNLGESNDSKCAVAYTVFLDLLECQILVDYYFDADIQSIYFKQQLNDNKIDYIFPMTVNENIDLIRLNRIRQKVCDGDDSKGMVVAVVCANGAVIYQRISDGEVLDFRIQK